MSQTAFPGPLYVLSLDPPPLGAKARLIRVHSAGLDCIAVFTHEDLARRWVAANTPGNSVLQPVPLADKRLATAFLTSLATSGDTHVCIDPTKHVGGLAEIPRLLALLDGLA